MRVPDNHLFNMLIQISSGRRALWYPTTEKDTSTDNHKIALFLPGFPNYPGKSHLIDMLLEMSYGVLVPMYSGTFESEGEFSIEESVEDVGRWYRFIKNGKFFTSLNTKKQLRIDEIILFSNSYGSLIAGLAMKTHSLPLIRKYFFLSPLWDMSSYKDDKVSRKIALETDRLLKFAFPLSHRFKNKKEFFRVITGMKNLEIMRQPTKAKI